MTIEQIYDATDTTPEEEHVAPDAPTWTAGRQPRSQADIETALAHCGQTWVRAFNPHTGQYEIRPFYCRIIHSPYGHCPYCLERRATELRQRIHAALEMQLGKARPLRFADVDATEQERIRRKYGKARYLACPLPDGRVRLFWEAAVDDERGAILDWWSVGEIDWEECAATPAGKNLSGALGQQKNDNGGRAAAGASVEAASAAASPVLIETTEAVIEGLTPEAEAAAVRASYLATIHLQPQTPEAVAEALSVRMAAFVSEVKRRGGHVVFLLENQRRLHPNRINWLQEKDLLADDITTPDGAPGWGLEDSWLVS